MIVVSGLVALLAIVLWLPSISDLVSLACLAFRRAVALPPPRGRSAEPPRLLFLVPAHNEELLLPACLVSLRKLRYPADRVEVVVIADNCTDQTAALARASGASCLERSDRKLPGKPRAIAWALTQVSLENFDAVIIIDAEGTVRARHDHRLGLDFQSVDELREMLAATERVTAT